MRNAVVNAAKPFNKRDEARTLMLIRRQFGARHSLCCLRLGDGIVHGLEVGQ